jgi:nucleotide-binding universal stress UspA family protein
MFRTVLVHLTGAETDGTALQTALQIVRPFGGHLNCLRTRLGSDARAEAASSVAMASAIAVKETVSVLKRQDERLTEQAKRSFDKFCDDESLVMSEEPNTGVDVTAAWIERPGTDIEQVIALGRFSDLLVLSRKSETHIGLTPAELGEVLLAVGRPVIITSPRTLRFFPKEIGIAWKDTAEAARALSAAMPIVAKTDHVKIFTVNEDSEHANECIDCMESIADSLRRHGPAVEVQYLAPGGRHLPETILEAAYESGVGLLVTGAYGHSRFRELVFGGFTQRILNGVNLSVLMFH